MGSKAKKESEIIHVEPIPRDEILNHVEEYITLLHSQGKYDTDFEESMRNEASGEVITLDDGMKCRVFALNKPSEQAIENLNRTFWRLVAEGKIDLDKL
ncbi:hypothetical protein [Paenibacillus anseongense]|uniref:hypothetical protein n=1 Tax=Paenibacillus anseongense TaxID=2682845 RepID=UPI002DC05A11|nr:hypothetical protein [Paenibacillus anseongense]MEC0265153.1 hypothetical protein [Paenibacillus anseongense]